MTSEEIEELLKKMISENPDFMPKYVVFKDGTTYFYMKDEDRYAICQQTPPIC
jgi:hypothetical protein